jgi:hypothetical protein
VRVLVCCACFPPPGHGATVVQAHVVMGPLLCRPTWKLNRFGRGCIATCRARGQDIGFARARTKFHVALLFQRVGPSLDPAPCPLACSHLTLACPSPLELSRVAHVHMRPSIFAAFSYGCTRVNVVV